MWLNQPERMRRHILGPKTRPIDARIVPLGRCCRMRALGERGVLFGEQALQPVPRTVPNWEAARIFLEVVRSGSFRAASENLGQSVNALMR